MPEYYDQDKVAEQINKLSVDLGWTDVKAIGNRSNGNVDVHIPGDKDRVVKGATIIAEQDFGGFVTGDGVHNSGGVFINGDDAGIHADLAAVIFGGVTPTKKAADPKLSLGDIDALNKKASMLLAEGNYMAALEVCTEVLRIDGNNPTALRNTAIAFPHVS